MQKGPDGFWSSEPRSWLPIPRISPSTNRSKLFDDLQNVLGIARLKYCILIYLRVLNVVSDPCRPVMDQLNRYRSSNVSISVGD